MAEPSPGVVPTAARRAAARWVAGMSKPTLAVVLMAYIMLVHLVGLGVFTYGFLLTRLTIPDVSPSYSASNPMPMEPTHSKAVIIVIDALRTDFISPYHTSPASPFHHGVLSLPAELSVSQPSHSLIFNAYSDPPTTTMQRIKGITTGSLPTFIDAGANFASTAITEDSIISQLVSANKSIAFMGDDTWMNLFPNAFTQAYPYDSFNVEDLHTVDNGVIEHIFPLLDKPEQWDVIIGHFLGVDHVGHRVGPDRETMRLKLKQMDEVLRRVVDKLDDDTLLVVLGDHGMNPKGDHGGDSDLETASALWMYSKGKPLVGDAASASRGYEWPEYWFPGTDKPLRHVNQIDLVPTLSLMLGVPIPFNSLGSVIPECFSRSPVTLKVATHLNTEQIERYIAQYGNREISHSVRRLASKTDIEDPTTRVVKQNRAVTLAALDALRALWAQFSVSHIVVGLVVLGSSVLAVISLYLGVRNGGPQWDVYVRYALDTAIMAGVGLGSVAGTFAGVYTRVPLVALQVFLVAAAGVSSLVLAAPLFAGRTWRGVSWNLGRSIGPIILILHALSFASNSYIMWEDRVVVFFLTTIAAVHFGRALTAPMASMRLNLLGLSVGFAALVRFMGLSTVCREEQQPYCTVTFYSGAAGTPEWAVYVLPLVAFGVLPRIVATVLSWSKSYAGPAPVFLAAVWRAVITSSAFYWTLDWMETWDGLNPERIPLVQLLKLWLARGSIGIALGALPYLWYTSGLCIKVVREPDQTGARADEVEVYGFGNAFGSTYLLFVLIAFSIVQLPSLAVSQIVLCALVTAMLIHLELVDTQRDAVIMQRNFANSANPGAFEPGQGDAIVRPSFTDVVPFALLALLGFFATGHQAVLATIQWKAAFIGFDTVVYPWSPLLVVINTWGPIALVAVAVPLLALWNISPRPNDTVPVLGHTVQVALAFSTYFATITFASALCAAWLRRHLMVWKVFAPRFMLGGVTLLVVDAMLIIAVGVGLRVTTDKVWRTFKSVSV